MLKEKREKEALFPFCPTRRSRVLTMFAVHKAQDAARKYSIDDQPDRRERDDDIGYDRPDAAIPHEDRGNEQWKID